MGSSPNRAFALAVAAGSILGLTLTFWPPVDASRNSSGTMSLVSGNPVVTGTSISSTAYNNTNSDFATELTDSLSRSGKGAMLAPLQLSNGTVALPSLTFGTDTDSGLYRIGANNVGLALNGAKVVDYATTGVAVTGTLSASAGFTATQSTSNGTAVTATGNGTGSGVTATGGASTGTGGAFTGGASSGYGITATGGSGGGYGGAFQGTGTGYGLQASGGATSGVGATLGNGVAATGGTRKDALILQNGDLDMSTVANATSTTSISERLTPSNIIKAHGKLTTTGGTSTAVTVDNGFNITSAADAGATLTVTIAADMASANYTVVVNPVNWAAFCYPVTLAAGTFTINCRTAAVIGTDFDFQAGASHVLTFIVTGDQ